MADISRGKRFAFRRQSLARRFGDLVASLNLKFGGMRDAIGTLSGGNQQKVILGRALGAKPKFCCLTIDQRYRCPCKGDLYELVGGLCEQGMSVVLYSSEDAELRDRVLVLNGGSVTDELSASVRPV